MDVSPTIQIVIVQVIIIISSEDEPRDIIYRYPRLRLVTRCAQSSQRNVSVSQSDLWGGRPPPSPFCGIHLDLSRFIIHGRCITNKDTRCTRA